MVSLAQGRFSLPDPQVAISQTTAPVDSTTANAIKAFGQIGGEAYRGYREGQLLNDLQETGNIINTINAGEEAIQQASREGSIDTASERFKRLASATSQGKISEQRAAIEAEVVLRESIAKAPGFADQFRSTAREVLGFDPSSASLNTLFMSGPGSESTALTEAQKDMQTAQAMFSGGIGTSIEDNYRLIQQEKMNELRETQMSSDIADGRVQAGKVSVEGALRASTRFNTAMLGAFGQLETQGGIVDTERFKGAIMSQADMVKQKIEQEMAASEYTYTPEHYANVRARIDEQRDAYLDILDNQDMTALLARNRDRLSDLVEIAGTQLAPHLAMLSNLGEPAQQAYMDLMVLSEGDPRKMEELMASNPRMRYVGQMVLQMDHIAPGIVAMAEGTTKAALGRGLDLGTARGVAVNEANNAIEGRPTSSSIGKIFLSLADTEMPRTALDMVGKTADRSYQEMTTEERAQVVSNFGTVTRGQMTNLNRVLSNAAADGVRLAWNGEQFVLRDNTGRPANQIVFFAPAQFRNEEDRQAYLEQVLPSHLGAQEALTYLNETMVPIVQNPNWSRELGMESGAQWVDQVINQVNLSQMGAEVEQGGPILETLDPAQVGEFRQAWQDGDVNKVMEVLSNMPQAGVGGESATGFQSGTIQRTAQPQPAAQQAQPAVIPEVSTEGQVGLINKQPLPAGLTPAEQLIADNEALHDVSDPNWDGKTVAWGFDLKTNPRAEEMKQRYGLEGMSNKEIGQWFQDNPEQAKQLLQEEISAHREELRGQWPEYDQLDDVRKAAIDNIAYNMGVPSLMGFPTMRGALAQAAATGDQEAYDTAAANLLFTYSEKQGKWVENEDYTKVGARAGAMAYMLATGEYPRNRQHAKLFMDAMRDAMEEANAQGAE